MSEASGMGGNDPQGVKMRMAAVDRSDAAESASSGRTWIGKAAILLEFNMPLVVEELEYRSVQAHEVLVKVEATSVCFTDTMIPKGMTFVKPPQIPGHAACGVVDAVGPGVTRVKVGQRVVLAASPECGECYWCVRQQPSFCVQMFGVMSPPRHVATRADGTKIYADTGAGPYSEYMNVMDFHVIPVEEDLPPEHLATLGCSCTTGLGCIYNLAEVTPASSVVVVGCGQCGLWMIQGARAAGATMIIAVEPIKERRQLAQRLGATHVVDPNEGDPVKKVVELTGGRGADFSIEAAGPPKAIEQAFMMTRYSGTMVPIGMTPKVFTDTVTFSAAEFVGGTRRIQSCNYGGCHSRRDIPRYAAMMKAGIIDAKPIVTNTYSLDQVNEVFRAVENYEIVGGAILHR